MLLWCKHTKSKGNVPVGEEPKCCVIMCCFIFQWVFFFPFPCSVLVVLKLQSLDFKFCSCWNARFFLLPMDIISWWILKILNKQIFRGRCVIVKSVIRDWLTLNHLAPRACSLSGWKWVSWKWAGSDTFSLEPVDLGSALWITFGWCAWANTLQITAC